MSAASPSITRWPFGYTWGEGSITRASGTVATSQGRTVFLDGAQALDYSRARYTSVRAESSDFARSVRQQRVLVAIRGKLGGGGVAALGPGLAIMDALKGTTAPLMATDLSAIDLTSLSGHLGADRRIELTEGVILEATSNSIGQYILVVIGRASGSDYAPLRPTSRPSWHDRCRTPVSEPFAEPAMTLDGQRHTHLRTVLRQLPLSPGVYLMKGPMVGCCTWARPTCSGIGSARTSARRPAWTRGSCG